MKTEVPGGVITNLETTEKSGVFGMGTMPVLAIIDPELMTSVPAQFKAYYSFFVNRLSGILSLKQEVF